MFEKRVSTHDQDHESISLRSFADKYVRYLGVTHSEKYTRDAKAAFRYLVTFDGDIALTDLTTKILEDFFLSSFMRAKFHTARNYRTIRAALLNAVEWSHLQNNPLKHFKFPRVPHNLPLFVTDKNLVLIMSHLPNKTIRDIVEFAFLTGCR